MNRDPLTGPGLLGRLLSVVMSGAFLVVLLMAVLSLDDDPGGLTQTVADRLEESGVDHPPTAVLLNFRAYDTWLEVAVLLLAMLGPLALRQATRLPERPAAGRQEPVLDWLVRAVFPLAVVTGMYLLWRGTAYPGGAFQAGAVIGGALVLLRASGYRSVGVFSAFALRGSLLAGFAGFLIISTVLLVAGQAFLEFPQSQASLLIVVVELLIAWSVAISFVSLLVATRPEPEPPEDARDGGDR